MSNSMLNSKGFLFFGLLLFVFLSFQVLAHHEENNANHLSIGGPDDDDPRDHNSPNLLVSQKHIPSIGYEYNSQSSIHNPSKFHIMDCEDPKDWHNHDQSSSNNPLHLGGIDENKNYHCGYYHKNGPIDDEDPRDANAQSIQQNPSMFRRNR
ncbi:PREDICTED: uncharacterized protein LOC109363652 [Lupinus angustifolius]|uniref:uncharacterized protein LOC109363652 n=1 Tax=Lupinus angustifolius TaxID=3871 RepID=UPI00092F5626|nr:PREDICTED: uncharacterized protein LOC109363652 [Lupinus angustifolius]